MQELVFEDIDRADQVSGKMYRNAETLLELYRKVKFRLENHLMDIDEELYMEDRKHLTSLLHEIVDFDTTAEKRRIQDRLVSVDFNLCLLEIMEDALIAMKKYPDNGEQLYRLLCYRYFDSFRNTNEQVMELLDEMPATTFYRKRKKAIQLYATMLWAYTRPQRVADKVAEKAAGTDGREVAV